MTRTGGHCAPRQVRSAAHNEHTVAVTAEGPRILTS